MSELSRQILRYQQISLALSIAVALPTIFYAFYTGPLLWLALAAPLGTAALEGHSLNKLYRGRGAIALLDEDETTTLRQQLSVPTCQPFLTSVRLGLAVLWSITAFGHVILIVMWIFLTWAFSYRVHTGWIVDIVLTFTEVYVMKKLYVLEKLERETTVLGGAGSFT